MKLKNLREKFFYFQTIVYHVSSHPIVNEYRQCISFESSHDELFNKLYVVFVTIMLYFAPLAIILVCYCKILQVIAIEAEGLLFSRESINLYANEMQRYANKSYTI